MRWHWGDGKRRRISLRWWESDGVRKWSVGKLLDMIQTCWSSEENVLEDCWSWKYDGTALVIVKSVWGSLEVQEEYCSNDGDALKDCCRCFRGPYMLGVHWRSDGVVAELLKKSWKCIEDLTDTLRCLKTWSVYVYWRGAVLVLVKCCETRLLERCCTGFKEVLMFWRRAEMLSNVQEALGLF